MSQKTLKIISETRSEVMTDWALAVGMEGVIRNNSVMPLFSALVTL